MARLFLKVWADIRLAEGQKCYRCKQLLNGVVYGSVIRVEKLLSTRTLPYRYIAQWYHRKCLPPYLWRELVRTAPDSGRHPSEMSMTGRYPVSHFTQLRSSHPRFRKGNKIRSQLDSTAQ
jgi:hypothetical protein